MQPTRPVGQNFEYKAPKGEEEEIGNLPVRRELDSGVAPQIYSAWKPSDMELALLVQGGSVEVGVWGMVPPPPISVNVSGPACEQCGGEAIWDLNAKAFYCAHPERDKEPGMGESLDRPDPYPGGHAQS